MLKDQRSVSQNFNSTSSIVNFNKRNNPQVDGFMRKKNFEAPPVVSKRGDIFGHNNQTKNALKPTLYINNSTRKTTGADLANVRPSFRKSNPVRYFSDFTIISAIENAHRAGKFHLDVSAIDRLKDYLRETDKEPNKNIDNVPDIIPTPKIIPYTPNDAPVPVVAPSHEIPNSDPGILPTQSKWKSRLWTAAKWAGILAALGMTYHEFGDAIKFGLQNNAGEVLAGRYAPDPQADEYGLDDFNFEDIEPSAPPIEDIEPSAPPMEMMDDGLGLGLDDIKLSEILGNKPKGFDNSDDDDDDDDYSPSPFNKDLFKKFPREPEVVDDEDYDDTDSLLLSNLNEYHDFNEVQEEKRTRDKSYIKVTTLRDEIKKDIYFRQSRGDISEKEAKKQVSATNKQNQPELIKYTCFDGKPITRVIFDVRHEIAIEDRKKEDKQISKLIKKNEDEYKSKLDSRMEPSSRFMQWHNKANKKKKK
jgi:hypothetical protein